MWSKMINDDYRNHISDNVHFDFVITDVPYGIGAGNMAFIKELGGVKQKNGSRMNIPKKGYGNESWDSESPKQDYFDAMKRISDEQIIFGVEYVDWVGLYLGRIKWNKGVPEGVSFKKYEMAYCSSIDYEYQLDYLWAGMMQGKSPMEPMTMQGNKKLNEKRIHPCHKPVIMWYMILEKFVDKGMSVFDSHAGGGSLRIACDLFGCSYTGCEINKATFLRQEKRWKQYKSKLTLF